MLGLFSRTRRHVSKQLRPPLWIEQLEDRCCPAGPPALTLSLDASVLSGHQVLLSGSVSGTNNANVNVTFSGAVNGTATTDASGNFSFTTTSADQGAVYAVGVDMNQQSTNTAEADIAVAAPTVTLSIASIYDNLVTLQGHVEDIDENALAVTLGGTASGTCACDSNGDFTMTVQPSALGDITAITTDLWGQSSNTGDVTLTSNAPLINNFAAIHGSGTTWTLQGSVDVQDPEGLTVTFGGLPSLSGVTASVQGDGTFSATVTLQADESGTATAQTTDWWGQQSNLAEHVMPPILSLTATVLANHQVLLSGYATGGNIANVNVTFGGAACGTATTDASGYFSFTTTDAELGTVSVAGIDQDGQETNTAQAVIGTQEPQLYMWIQLVYQNQVVLAGHVDDVDTGLTVKLGGTAAGSVQTDQDGNFSITVTPTQLGAITAATTDLWGDASNTAAVSVSSDPPFIYNCSAVQQYGTVYTFSGNVLAADPSGLIVTLGGIASANGMTTTVQPDGTWTLSVTLQASEIGQSVTFQTTDWWSQASNLAWVDTV